MGGLLQISSWFIAQSNTGGLIVCELRPLLTHELRTIKIITVSQQMFSFEYPLR
jgi:hypothetical protein